jgi:hypothetical protein
MAAQSPVEVRSSLVSALQLDLIGPCGELGDPQERLPQMPSRWYLTGFLVPTDAESDQAEDPGSADELDQAAEPVEIDESTAGDKPAARVTRLSSSMGMSVLVAPETTSLEVEVRYGEYTYLPKSETNEFACWARQPRAATLNLKLGSRTPAQGVLEVPDSGGVEIAWSMRKTPELNEASGLPKGTRSLSVFVVNRRKPAPSEVADQSSMFQVELTLRSAEPLVARPNLQHLNSEDLDERVADLQYRNACEFSVGHSVATSAEVEPDGTCRVVRTTWLPTAEVEKVMPADIPNVNLKMDELAALADAAAARAQLGGLVSAYRGWIEAQRALLKGLHSRRKETADELLRKAGVAAGRIEAGIELMARPDCLEAFRIANRAMAAQGRRRLARMLNRNPAEVKPQWRPFQLAFLLMNLKGIAEPESDDREFVDLLFFPTGGGKTEAYLGLAAFTLVLRRLRNPGVTSGGLSVLMRYTLRLLTLDQLGRAAALICALELEREKDVEKLGRWPFEIGLWVGQAATPNERGRKGDNNPNSARAKTIAFLNDDRKPSPIPLETCPWCDTKFKRESFRLVPNRDYPTDLLIKCLNRDCEFSGGRTVDKFAAMPWVGEVGALFGRVDRHDKDGFYGPCDPQQGQPIPGGRLPPPDLIIQDELHLISGPLGTMVGLYETALDELATVKVNGKGIRPKIIASTATVRRAAAQIRALFNRREVDVFPPPGPNVRDSFFAVTRPATEVNAREYLGVAAQGRSAKVIMLRVYLALLSAAQKAFFDAGGARTASNPADPYMTLLGYFNSLRELGGARRIIEDEVRTQLVSRGIRKRLGEPEGMFRDREIAYEPVELTSRVSTDKVSDAKRRLELNFYTDSDPERERQRKKGQVDIAIATNMISVGLDITRLGLMVCFGQPKTSAEYIQATSRVGRDDARPGLVVTILNLNRPRDRSHYERFSAFHQTFYRSVEATSVTPFSPRALDRGLAGTLIALARLGHAPMTPPKGAGEILREYGNLQFAVEALANRAGEIAAASDPASADAVKKKVQGLCRDLLDTWEVIAKELRDTGGQLQYQQEAGAARRLLYEFLNPELKTLPGKHRKFRANRSLRDVEPSVNLWVKTIDGRDLDMEEDV